MKNTMKVAAVILAMCAAIVLAGNPSEDEASTLKGASLSTYSIPFVDDANDAGEKAAILTLTCYGNAKSFSMKVVDAKSGKRLNVAKHKNRVWTATVKRFRTYRISVKGVGGKWKSIEYGIY